MENPEFLKQAVVYQISLRSFTREGTFRAAERMLPHVRNAGVDIVYLTPFVKMDPDMDRRGWSPRQIASGFETPKNPYRISDYSKVDVEYGSAEDAASFVNTAHGLGMKVVFDLVYLHCGPDNVIQYAVPDAFQKNPDGSVRMTQWKFPYLNYESAEMREYLFANMEYLALELGCDGFRCDVGDEVPLDFWEEGFRRIREKKPGFFGFNEGWNPEYLKVFNANYGWKWSYGILGVLRGEKKLAAVVEDQRAYEEKCPRMPFDLLFLENHDTATDSWADRIDRVLPVEAGNAFFVANFLRPGIPVIYNGNEIADRAMMTFFGPVEDPRRAFKTVDWGNALQSDGQKRLALLRTLSELRHTVPAIADGGMKIFEETVPCDVFSFQRLLPNNHGVLVVVNLSSRPADFELKTDAGQVLISEGVRPGALWHAAPWGYYVSTI